MWQDSDIQDFIKAFGFKCVLTKGEIKTLPSILQPDEKLLALVEGELKKIHNRNIGGNGLAILTSKRFIIYRKSIIGTITMEETPINRISSASYRKGLMFGSIVVFTANNESVIDHCDNGNAKKTVDALQGILHAAPQQNAVQPQTDNASELKKWFDLKVQGVISDQEYEAKKRQLLNL